MDWITSLLVALGIERRREQKKEEHFAAEMEENTNKVSLALSELSSVLDDLFINCGLSLGDDKISSAQDLIPLYPMAEVLSAQGYVSAAQENFLRIYLIGSASRYNLHQFVTLAVERGEGYREWYNMTALEYERCGEVWHTLIEAICRLRRPEVMQSVVDAIGKILYHFHFLEEPTIDLMKLRYGHIINSLNIHAERDQRQPYLHAVMLLQTELAAAYGGVAQDYEPVPEDEPLDMDGVQGYCFWVHKSDVPSFHHRFAVRECSEPGKQPDLIWELHHTEPPTVFFSE